MGLFKGKLNIDKVFSSISSGIDNLAFTDQEKAELHTKLSDKVADFAHSTMSENTQRSKARRTIAYIVIGNFFAMVWAIVILFLFDEKEAAQFVYNLGMEWKIATSFIVVISFFFGSYLLRGTKIKKDK